MSDLNLIFGLITLGCGIYCLLSYRKMRTTGIIPPNSMILPKDRTIEQCLDKEFFLSYMMPRLLVFSVLICLCGIFSLVNDWLGLIKAWTQTLSPMAYLLILEGATCFLPLAVVIWFAACLKKAHKEFW